MKKSRLTVLMIIFLAVMMTLSMTPAGIFAVEEPAVSVPETEEITEAPPEEEVVLPPEEAEPEEEAEPASVIPEEDQEPAEEAAPAKEPEEEKAPAVEEGPAEEEEAPAKEPEAEFEMTLPTVYLHINGGQAEVDRMNASEDHSYHCKGTMDIIVPEGFRYVDSDKAPSSVTGLSMDIRGRGNTSWGTGKNPYKIKLDKKASILGMGKNKHWALIANYYDPSLMRNRVTYWLGRELGMPFTPSGYPVDVFMEGEYYGSYLLTETMRVDDNRVEIDELTEDITEGIELTGGYFIQFIQDYDTPAVFQTEKGVSLQNVDPNFDVNDDGYENDAQKNYIRGYVQETEDALYEGETRDKSAPGGYRSLDYHDYIDLDTSAMYWLFHEFTMNGDAYGTGSSYFYKTRDTADTPGKIFWGPLWDFDYAYDYMGPPDEGDDFVTGTEWMDALMTDTSEDGLPARIREEWPLMKAKLQFVIAEGGLLDQYYDEVKASQAYDQAKYGWEDDEGGPRDYQAAVETLRDWIQRRIVWMDQHLADLNDYSHKVYFKLDKKDEHPKVYVFRTGYTIYCDIKDPVKKGYLFLGWYTEDGRPEHEVKVTKDTTVYARFIDEDKATKATDIWFPFEELYLLLDDGSYMLRYTLTPFDAQDKRVRWTSSDPSVAAVEIDDLETVIMPYKLGTTTITAHLPDGSTKSFKVTVGDKARKLKSAALVKDPIYMKVGDIKQVLVRTDPVMNTNPYFVGALDGIVSVDVQGVIEALAPGETIVTVYLNYYDQKKGWVEDEMECTVIVSDREGTLTTDVITKGIEGSAEDLPSAAPNYLTGEDREDLAGGADIEVDLTLSLQKEQDPAFDAYLEKHDLTAGPSVDIGLKKTVAEEPAEAIHEIPSPLSFTLTVPEEYRNTDADIVRTFHLLRLHDGKVTEVGSGTDAEITGETDLFSPYLLAYEDGTPGRIIPTGDDTRLWLAGLALLIALLLMGAAAARKKKK